MAQLDAQCASGSDRPDMKKMMAMSMYLTVYWITKRGQTQPREGHGSRVSTTYLGLYRPACPPDIREKVCQEDDDADAENEPLLYQEIDHCLEKQPCPSGGRRWDRCGLELPRLLGLSRRRGARVKSL